MSYNLNLNIIPAIQKQLVRGGFKPEIYWDFDARTISSYSLDMDTNVFATMSIVASGSNCINVVSDSGNFFVTRNQEIVSASIVGAGVWPVTGSNVMQLYVAGIPVGSGLSPIYSTKTVTLTAASGNMAQSHSLIETDFTMPDYYIYYISGSVKHFKANPYNPLVTWKTINQTPISDSVFINNYSSSFNIKKDVNVPLASVPTITGSVSSSFQYEYNFGVTSSLTSSIQSNATGSTTMSISIPEAGITTSSYYFNATSAGRKIITASFAATTNNQYNITASVIYNKGNISNSDIKVLQSGSTYSSGALFNVVKDANVNIIAYKNVYSASTFNFTNDYAFNITASISGSKNWPDSSSFQALTMSLSIPEIGYYITASHTASLITASFAAQTNINPYTITASIELEPYPNYYLEEYILIGGGGAGGYGNGTSSPGGGGAGAVLSGSQALIYSNSVYQIVVGAGGIGTTVYVGNTAASGGDTYIATSSIVLRAPGGGGGANGVGSGGSAAGADGGFGGGGVGSAASGGTGGIAIACTGSGIFTQYTGSGNNGATVFAGPPPANRFSFGGNGGGASLKSGSLIYAATGSGYPSGSVYAVGGNSGGAPPGYGGGQVSGSSATTYGSGGGGSDIGYIPGNGYQGIVVIKYLAPQKGRGGLVTTDGTYVYHTFYSSSTFYSTAAMTPKQH